jgi:MoxR-like ATPase
VVKLLKVAAWSNGQKKVTIWDCWLLQHCLWDAPEKKEQIAAWFHSHVGVGSGFNSERLNKLVSTWERVLHNDTDSKVQLTNADHQLLYMSADGEQTTEKSYSQWHKRGEELLYLSPPDQPDRTHAGQGFTADELLNEFFDDRKQQSHIRGKWQHIDRYLADSSNRFVTDIENSPIMVAKHHKEAFIQGRVDEVERLRDDIQQFKKNLQAQYDSLDRSNSEHLWLDPDFIKMADDSLIYSIEQADAFIERLGIVLDGYFTLPTLAA